MAAREPVTESSSASGPRAQTDAPAHVFGEIAANAAKSSYPFLCPEPLRCPVAGGTFGFCPGERGIHVGQNVLPAPSSAGKDSAISACG